MFSKKLFVPILGAALIFASCEKDSSIDNQDDIVIDDNIVDKIEPVDFQYLTLNRTNMYGEVPSISFMSKDGVMTPRMYYQTNNEDFPSEAVNALQVKDRLFLVVCDYWGFSGFMEVNPNTLLKVSEHSLNGDFLPYDMISLGGDSVLLAGAENNGDYNIVIGDINSEEFTKRKINSGNDINYVRKIKNKVFFAGSYSNSAVISVADINNINNDSFRTILEDVRLGSKSSNFCIDKNNNIWFSNKESGSYMIYCIDTESETVKHKVSMPRSITTLNELAMAISKDKDVIYIRNHKAFFTMNVDSPETPDEPLYEYRDHVGVLNDLKVAANGNLLFLNETLGLGIPSEVIELSPNTNAEWSLVGITETGISSSKIFVPAYE